MILHRDYFLNLIDKYYIFIFCITPWLQHGHHRLRLVRMYPGGTGKPAATNRDRLNPLPPLFMIVICSEWKGSVIGGFNSGAPCLSQKGSLYGGPPAQHDPDRHMAA
jgi:hypothetical protein